MNKWLLFYVLKTYSGIVIYITTRDHILVNFPIHVGTTVLPISGGALILDLILNVALLNYFNILSSNSVGRFLFIYNKSQVKITKTIPFEKD